MRVPLISLASMLTGLFAVLFASTSGAADVFGGDQILDGIGETSLIARYTLAGNAEDRSRDSHHAALRGAGARFVDDQRFGRVLSLSGEPGVGLELPAAAMDDAESISVVAWVYLRSDPAGQRLFHFGRGAASEFYCALASGNEGYRARIRAGAAGEQGPAAAAIGTGRWVHLAVVLDPAGKTLTTYVDGARAAQAKDVTVGMDKVLDHSNPDASKVYIGRSHDGRAGGLNAMVHDLRLYRVALTDEQVATIRGNAMAGTGVAAIGGKAVHTAPQAAATTSASLKLAGVPDITATTVVGQLPRLPVMLPATYENGAMGPDVRVIWPSPRNNNDVLKAGTYAVIGRVPGTGFTPKATVTILDAAQAEQPPARALEAFPLGQVVLNPDARGRDTHFIRNRDKFIRGLARTNPDNFLYMFRDAFGQPQPEGARPLGGWDNQTTRLRGHATGHYLSALAQACAGSSYDETLRADFLKRMNYMIDALYDLSRKSGTPKEPGGPAVADPTAVPPGPGRSGYDSNLSASGIRTDYWNWGNGFISAYPPDQFIMLERGATYGGSNNQIWAPYYTLHKILAGLLDCYEVGGNKKALEIASGMGLWTYQRLKIVPLQTRIAMWNRYIAGEYGGMNEVMARLNRLTGDPRFLEAAKLFDNIDFFFGNADHAHGLAANVDTIRGKHANQHIPQIIGALEVYRNSREPAYFRIASNFWDITVNSYTYCIGGVAGAVKPNNAECFTAEPDTLFQNGFAQGGQCETCATYNMLKLSRQLFMFRPGEARYMNYYEQALYNQILGSVAEDNAANTYHIPLNPGSRKGFGNANLTGFTCCNGTALESSTKLQDSIYFRSSDSSALYVNLYIPSTLKWSEKNAVVKQETSFPSADTTRLTITGGNGLDIRVRVPAWATRGFFVKIDGAEKQVAAKPGTYVSLGSQWKDGATIELRMPLEFHLSRVMDQPNIAALLYGPVVLAADEPAARADWRPLTLDLSDLGKAISGDPSTLRFRIGDVTLQPFSLAYGRYSVYFDLK